jgi:hypothetical protein
VGDVEPPPLVGAALGLALVCWIIGGEWVSIHEHVPENHFIDALGGLSFLVAGLVALDRRPGNAIGKLMIAYVIVSYCGNWSNLQITALPAIGSMGSQLSGAILAQMALSYPTGRLRTRFERLVIGMIYAVAIGVGLVILLAFDPGPAAAPGAPGNPPRSPAATPSWWRSW